jgi:hypothetical protein
MKSSQRMNPYDNETLRDVALRLSDLGVREDDEDLIRDVARQWTMVIPDNLDSTSLNSTGEDNQNRE